MLDADTTARSRELYEARKSAHAAAPLLARHPQMTIADGYAIQRAWVALELADGRRIRAARSA
jgi:2-oxo-hept-3-ene-1,7-dioate hydratase